MPLHLPTDKKSPMTGEPPSRRLSVATIVATAATTLALGVTFAAIAGWLGPPPAMPSTEPPATASTEPRDLPPQALEVEHDEDDDEDDEEGEDDEDEDESDDDD